MNGKARSSTSTSCRRMRRALKANEQQDNMHHQVTTAEVIIIMKNRPPSFQCLPQVVLLLLVLGCVAPWALFVGSGVGPLDVLLAIPGLVLMLWLTTAVHELGHLLAAW